MVSTVIDIFSLIMIAVLRPTPLFGVNNVNQFVCALFLLKQEILVDVLMNYSSYAVCHPYALSQSDKRVTPRLE